MSTGWQMRDDDPQPRGPMKSHVVEMHVEADHTNSDPETLRRVKWNVPGEEVPPITEAVIEEAVRQTLAGRGGRREEMVPNTAVSDADLRRRQAELSIREREHALLTNMPNADVIATIRRLATGKYVHVEKLIEALS